MPRQRILLHIVVHAAIVEVLKVLDENVLEKVKVGHEDDRVGEEINSAELSLTFQLEIKLREELRRVKLPSMSCKN